jgi:septum formation protein
VQLRDVPRTLVLGSTSKYRRALLDAAGVRYVAAAPPFEERHDEGFAPDALAVTLAIGKARSLGGLHPDALIVGADQVPAIDGRVLGKPGTRDAAVLQLLSLQGRTHELHTAVAVLDARSGQLRSRLMTHLMTMRSLSRAQAEAYVDHDAPLDCAGAYRVEARGALLFESMRGDDHTAIVGLPLTALATLLRELGHDLLDA